MRIVNIISGALLWMLAVSCSVKEGYEDLSRPINKTVSIFGDIDVPVGDTYPLLIGEMLGLDQYGLIDTDESGNYVLDLDGPSISGSLKSPKFTFDLPSRRNGSVVIETGGTPVSSLSNIPDFDVPEMLLPIQIDQYDIPEQITSIEGLSLDAIATISLDYSVSGVNSIVLRKGLRLSLPDGIVVRSVDGSDFDVESGSGDIVSTCDLSLSNSRKLNIKIHISEIELSSLPDGQGLVESGHFVLNDHIAVSGKMKVSSVSVSTLPDITLNASIGFDRFKLNSITCTLGQDVDLEGVDFEVDAVPSLFSDAVLDICGAGLLVSGVNDTPCDMMVSFTLSSIDMAGKKRSIPVKDLLLPSGVDQAIYISEDGRNAPSDCISVLVEDFDDLFYSVPSRIIIDEAVARPAGDGPVTMALGRSFAISLDYGVIVVPLIFGEEMRLSYNYDMDVNLSGVPDGVQGLALNVDVVNSIPMDMTFDIEAIDREGRAVSGVKSESSGIIRAGVTSSPSTSPVSMVLNTSGARFKDIHGIRFIFNASMSKEYSNIPINENQAVQLNNISVGLRGGYEYTLHR